MKKYLMLYTVAVMSIMLIITGCKKVYDYIDTHPDADIKFCPIQKLVFFSPYTTYVDTLTFKYNIWGNPISITRPHPGTGAPNYQFRYDNYGRLTEFIGVYSDGISTELWHRYFYDGQNRIITDSVYVFADMVNGQLSNPYDSYVNLLNYDSKNRVSLETRIWDGHTTVFNYPYDATGNITGPVYDQKTNFHRTNKIWMFLDRDYSLNNPFQAISYNSLGLPTNIGVNSYGQFLYNSLYGAIIEYMCSNQKPLPNSKDY